MAGYDLIDRYLAGLSPRLAWHRRRDEVECELRDHLYSAVEALERTGVETESAQHRVLARFGESGIVATAFASTGSSGPALPTEATRDAGRLALVAALLWVLVGGGMGASYAVDEATGEWEGAAQLLFIGATGALLGAAVLTVFVLRGLQQRHGGLGVLGHVGIGLASLGVVAGFASWFVYGWGALIGAGSLVIAFAMFRRGLAPSVPTVFFGGAWIVASALGASLSALEVGPRDQWGEYPLATVIMVGTGSVAIAAGFVGIGRWLATEDVVPVPAVVLP